MEYKKICAAIGGAAIVSAALMGIASASTTGLNEINKSFIYDENYNPVAQIAVGEKAQAKDVVGAGNIAAVIGNLAYTQCAGNASSGEVKLAVKSWLLLGKYEQDKRAITNPEFYGTPGYKFGGGGQMVYKKGSLQNYNIGCEIAKSVAEFPKEGEYCNEICYLCHNICEAEVSHPTHKMVETITVNWDNVKYYEDGLGDSASESLKMHLDCETLNYSVDLNGIPTTALYDSDNKLIDTAYRGRILFMGSDQYYVSDLSRNSITLSKGVKLKITDAGQTEITSENAPDLSSLIGYKFKLQNILQVSGNPAGVLVEVERPDGTTATVQATKMGGAIVPGINGHNVEIQAYNALGSPGTAGMNADIIVYDTATRITLENNKKKDGWLVKIEAKDCKQYPHERYNDIKGTKYCLDSLSLIQQDEATLNVGDSILFPTKEIKFTFEGFKTNEFKNITCSGDDGQIKLTTEGKHKILMSFTDSDGVRYENVRLDGGPYNVGDTFLYGNSIYKFKEVKDVINPGGSVNDTKKDIVLTDLTNVRDITTTLDTNSNGFPEFTYVTFNGQSESESNCSTCKTYKGNAPMPVFLKESGYKLYVVNDTSCTNCVIGLNNITIYDDFQNDDCKLTLTEEVENGTADLNSDPGSNKDDILLNFVGCGTGASAALSTHVYVDFYDRNYTSGDYSTGISVHNATNKIKGIYGANGDSVLYTCADKYTATYGDKKQLKSVTICHPKKEAHMTYFLGKEKQESEIIATLTQEDVGKLKKAACCEFTVKTFGLSSGAACNSKVNSIGNIVVTDTKADTSKNLIVVGGPVVNTLAQDVTKDEISADPDKYVIKKVGNKLIVAGWEADDTIAATNKVVEWLKQNIHMQAII